MILPEVADEIFTNKFGTYIYKIAESDIVSYDTDSSQYKYFCKNGICVMIRHAQYMSQYDISVYISKNKSVSVIRDYEIEFSHRYKFSDEYVIPVCRNSEDYNSIIWKCDDAIKSIAIEKIISIFKEYNRWYRRKEYLDSVKREKELVKYQNGIEQSKDAIIKSYNESRIKVPCQSSSNELLIIVFGLIFMGICYGFYMILWMILL
ncbi:MAG: hypothetical protein HGA35_05905 [Erysipelotrichaceae bacterium]|nr:hypothetical protein [Erysipelotrichaceae bacterium]